MGGAGARARRNERRFLAGTRLQNLQQGGRSRGRGIRKPAFVAAVSASGIPSPFGLEHITGSMLVSEFGRSPFTLLKLGGGFLYDPRHTCACCDKPIDERFVRRVVVKGHPPPRWCWTCKERRFTAFTAADTIARAYRFYIAHQRALELRQGVLNRLPALAHIFVPASSAGVSRTVAGAELEETTRLLVKRREKEGAGALVGAMSTVKA